METEIINVRNLQKSFNGTEVLKDLNLSIPKGQIYALLGSNGAGKSTIIKILSTLLKQDEGTVSINNYDNYKNPEKIQKIISLTGQYAAVDMMLTGRENMILIAKLKHLKNFKTEIDTLLKRFELFDAAEKLASTYSGGMLRKLDLAMSLIGKPEIIFLDEPTTGLDPQGRIEIWKMIKNLSQTGTTILLTTQYLDEAEVLADRVAILNQGVIQKEGTVSQLKSLVQKNHLELIFNDETNFTQAAALFPEAKIEPETYTLTLTVTSNLKSITDTLKILEDNNIVLKEFFQLKPNLEDVFLSIVNSKNGGN